MKNIFILLLTSLFLAGCFEVGVLVKVNRDGSGTVEQTILMNKALVQQMEELSESFGENNNKKFSLIDKKKLIKDAAEMGEGVYFMYTKPVSDKDREGYIAYYSFKDINKLKINQNPSDKAPLPSDGESKAPKEPVTFSFKTGKEPVLIIRQPDASFTPDSEFVDADEPQEAADDTSGMEMMMEMMKGLRVSIAAEVNGKILKTNAAFVDNNRITLMEMDFEKLIRDREKFKEISKQKPKSMEEAKKLFKDIPGIKFETEKEISIQFR
ncbi:MAG: hypothetical protein JXA06_06775 [Bacteroidetes bacterium]|nr:hypothetical protein [Bacteroidota bacterium]